MSKKSRKPDAPKKVRDVFVARPFAGLADEPEWVALRELVPAATAPLRLNPEYAAKYGERDITLATILPMAWPALTKPDGRVLVGLQRHERSGDINRDLAVALLNALETNPGGPVTVPPLPGTGPRLADVIVNEPLEIAMRDGFDFWIDADQGAGRQCRGIAGGGEFIDLPDRADGGGAGGVLVPGSRQIAHALGSA